MIEVFVVVTWLHKILPIVHFDRMQRAITGVIRDKAYLQPQSGNVHF